MTEEQVFLGAIDLPDAAARTAYLDETCGEDAELRRRVETLLAAHFKSGAFLDVPAAEQGQADSRDDNTVAHDGDAPSPRRPSEKGGRAEDNTVAHEEDAVSAGKDREDESDELPFLTPSTRPDSLGRLGHYEMLQVLGKGGFGIVFRAFDDTLQRVVAVKVMAPQIATLSPARRRFLREAQSSAQVRHENVVQVYEVGEQPLPYLAMEFIPGETLQQKLDRTGPLDVSEVLRVGRQIAEGLAAAHVCDLIHRDIKPANVLIEGGPRQRVKITDFGLARAADDASISQSGIIAGTPMFMAPEQALGHKIDQRADLFSLGSVLYQMVSGRPPFRAPSALAVLKRVAEEPPRPIPEIIPETPVWLCEIIAKLHAKNPDERFQSAREVADVLADCEAQLKAHAKIKDFSRIPRGKPRRSGRWKWAAAAAVLLVPVIALAVTEFAGVTHLFRGRQGAVTVIPKDDPKAEPKTPVATGRFALAFDGKESRVKIPSLKITEAHPLTVEAWTVVEDGIDPNKGLELLANAGGNQGFALGIPPAGFGAYGGEKWGFAIVSNSADDYVQAWEKQPVPRKELVHLAGIYDGKGEIRFYVDGRLQSRTPATDIRPSTYANMRLGADHMGENRFLGRMNEVRISKVARYDADFTPAKRWEPDADTLALYHFDEGGGAVLSDSSGNGHHGEIIGATWVKADGSPISPPATAPLPPTFTNSIGMEFAIVPKGKSWLGGGKDKLGDQEVVIPADFYLGKYEVTQEEWEKVMGENPSQFSRTGSMDAVKDINDSDLKRFPVESVSWDECQIFVAKLNKLEKETSWSYRLPTEAEWEYACRGGPMADKLDSAFDFYFAKPTNTPSPKQANFNGVPNRTCKVGTYEPNVLGLYDMHGNVSEWCDDTGRAANGLSQPSTRGGCWNVDSGACRATDRATLVSSARFGNLGLRVVRVPSDAPSPEAKTPPPAVAPFTDADAQRIVALPAEQQVEEVRKELMRRNPGFDGQMKTKIEDGVVTEFRIVTDQVTDIAPIRVFNALRVLECRGTWTNDQPHGQLSHLTPLEGMNLAGLTYLNLVATKVTDAGLATFKDCKNLTCLSLGDTRVSDAGLIFFKDCKALTALYLHGTNVSDAGLANFKDCKNLMHLHLERTQVADAGLAHFKDCKKLTDLVLSRAAQVSDAGLAHFKGMPLRVLFIYNTGITDLTPLQGMPLEEIRLTPKNITRSLDVLRDMKSLKTIGIKENQAWPAAEFWERYDKGEFGLAPLTDTDVQRIAALPAEQQVEEVRKELKRRNPGFDGQMETKIEGGVVTELRIVTDQVTDIAPIRVWGGLRVLDCSGTWTNGRLADLTPFKGMNLADLTYLNLSHTKASDAGMAAFKDCKGLTQLALWTTPVTDAGLAYFKECKDLTWLKLDGTQVTDAGLTHFKDCKNLGALDLSSTNVTDEGMANFKECENLYSLWLSNTQVGDKGLANFKDCKNLTDLNLGNTKLTDAGLAKFKGLPLTVLRIQNTSVTDLTPLQGTPLEEIRLTPKNITRGLDILRDMKSLKTIGIEWKQSWPAAEFWQRYDKGEFKE